MTSLKMQAILMTLLMSLFSAQAFSQEIELEVSEGKTVTIEANQIDDVIKNLDSEADKQKDNKVKKSFKKIAEKFKDLKEEIKTKNDNKTKKKISLRGVLFGAGKASTYVSVQMARPFVNATAFLTGFFEKPQKNIDELEYMKLFLRLENHFSDMWQDIDHVSQFDQIEEAFTKRADKILTERREIIMEDLEAHFADKPEEISTESIVAFINAHPAYQDFIPVLGELKSDCLECYEDMEIFADPLKLFNAMRITIAEGVGSFAAKTIIPKMALSIISKSLGGAVLGVGLVADAGMITSALMCTVNKKNVALIEEGDDELKEFCQYVVNKSAYTLSKSRVKGYVAGKNFRRKVIQKSATTKQKLDKKFKKKDELNVQPQ
jgi:hypothetical protein